MQDVIEKSIASGRPIIGITSDYVDPSEKQIRYSSYPWYAMPRSYIKTLVDLGAFPLILLCTLELIDDYIEKISGLIISGGHFDVDPKLYGAETIHPKTKVNSVRGQFEFNLVKAFLETKKPVLGICGGMQIINVIYGGSLIQDIADNQEYMSHLQSPPYEPHHEVEVTFDSLLYKIVEAKKILTNTSHHQAVKDVGKNLKVNAVAIDGIIEGIEDPSHPFCLGVQWHPEWQVSPADLKIVASFIEKCR